MRTPALRKLTAPLAGAVLVQAGCTAEQSRPAAGGLCATAENGTPSPRASQSAGSRPGVGTSYRSEMTLARTAHYAAATANPLATREACEVLKDGGTAADALIAAQAVLGLVEPQSSGIGGGGFLLYYDAEGESVQAYDGRETAPAAATENYLRRVSDTEHTVPKPDARASGRWRDLFAPAVTMADEGFDISSRLAAAIADAAPPLKMDPEAAGYFPNSDGTAKTADTRLTDRYMADPDFVPPTGGTPDTLLNSAYLARRAALISEQRSMGTAEPGEFGSPPSARGPLFATLGSPGGAVIIQFVVKTIVGLVDWGMDPQQAVGMVDFGAANSPKTRLVLGHPR